MKKPQVTWSDRELEFLDNNYHLLTNKEISKALFKINSGTRRSFISIKSQANKRNLKSGFYWRKEETDYLAELIGEYPLNKLIKKYQNWAKNNGLRSRSALQISKWIKTQRKSIRLNASTKYLTNTDLRYLLGCNRVSVNNLLKTYKDELKPKRDGKKTYVSRVRLKAFLLDHQYILERYQCKLDIRWLVDILGNY